MVRKGRQLRYCTLCSKKFLTNRSQKKFCSCICRNLAFHIAYKNQTANYLLSLDDETIKQKYTRKYVERLLKVQIPSNYVVHHMDKNRSNNNIENLVLITRQNHRNLHLNKKNVRYIRMKQKSDNSISLCVINE